MSFLIRSFAAGALLLILCELASAQVRPGGYPASYASPPPVVRPYVPPPSPPAPHYTAPSFPTPDLYNNFPYYGRYKLPGYYGQYPYDPASGYPSYYDINRREAPSGVRDRDTDEEEPDTSTGAQGKAPAAKGKPDDSAHVHVKVPADARVWFDGSATTSKGSERDFTSPSLPRGHKYQYEVRASWKEAGHDVTQSQRVTVTAGSKVEVTFPTPK